MTASCRCPQPRSAPLVRRTLEPSICARPGAKSIAAQLSLYCAAYSPVGQGTVAYIDIPGSEGLTAVCTDNPEAWSRFYYGHHDSRQLIIHLTAIYLNGSATFSRAGRIDRNPSWTIQSECHTLTATWEQLESPLVGPPTINPHIVFTALIFAAAGQMQLDGTAIPGSPYPREAWSKSLGQARSSCCFALAETMVAGHSSDAP